MNKIIKFCERNRNLFIWVLPIIIIGIAFVVALDPTYFLPKYLKSEIIGGLFLLSGALITAIFAIQKYHTEERTSRLQKLYFEDTLYGQAKILESMMSQTTKNYLNIENLFNLSHSLIDQKNILLENKTTGLENIFENSIKNISLDINTADFKKETISKLLFDAKTISKLPDWIKIFQADAYRFSPFLQGQVLVLKSHLQRLNDNNLSDFKSCLKQISAYIQSNYILIERHYTLFNLFSELVLEFVTVQYTNTEKIFHAFNNKRTKKIINLINDSYGKLITDFEDINIAKITDDDAGRLSKALDFVKNKISKELYDRKNS